MNGDIPPQDQLRMGHLEQLMPPPSLEALWVLGPHGVGDTHTAAAGVPTTDGAARHPPEYGKLAQVLELMVCLLQKHMQPIYYVAKLMFPMLGAVVIDPRGYRCCKCMCICIALRSVIVASVCYN